jgi:hypothetical protein
MTGLSELLPMIIPTSGICSPQAFAAMSRLKNTFLNFISQAVS